MTSDPLFIVMIVSMLIVAGILLVGIGGFAKGGEFNRKHANKVMRMRLIAQLVAVVIIVLFVYISRGA